MTSAVSIKHLEPKRIVEVVLYALMEQRIGPQARHASLQYSPSTGWRLVA